MFSSPFAIIYISLWAAIYSVESANVFEQADPSSNVCPTSFAINARGEIECAMFCSASDTCKSCTYLPPDAAPENGNRCLITDQDNCTLAAGVPRFSKKISAIFNPNLGVKFLQRFNTSSKLNFSRPWTEYESGFGDANGEFWLGLRNISSLINSTRVTLRVEIINWNGDELFIEYNGFTVGNAGNNYLMTYTDMGNRSSEVVYDAMASNKGAQFSAMDRDNDLSSAHCSQQYGGNAGFWFGNCGEAHPTAPYPNNSTGGYGRMFWYYSSSNGFAPLREVRMYLRLN